MYKLKAIFLIFLLSLCIIILAILTFKSIIWSIIYSAYWIFGIVIFGALIGLTLWGIHKIYINMECTVNNEPVLRFPIITANSKIASNTSSNTSPTQTPSAETPKEIK